eukprot:365985-Chlamydomonas_euryale.AAC.14
MQKCRRVARHVAKPARDRRQRRRRRRSGNASRDSPRGLAGRSLRRARGRTACRGNISFRRVLSENSPRWRRRATGRLPRRAACVRAGTVECYLDARRSQQWPRSTATVVAAAGPHRR